MSAWIEYRDGFRYQLASDCTIQTEITGYDIDTEYIRLTPDGKLTLKHGYASDGASGPTIHTRNSIRAAFAHDAFYYLIRNGLIGMDCKTAVDSLFREMLIKDGMWQIRAAWWYLAVKTQGANSLYPSKEKPILRAP